MKLFFRDNGTYLFASSDINEGDMSSKYAGREVALKNRANFLRSLDIQMTTNIEIQAQQSNNIAVHGRDGGLLRIDNAPIIDTDFRGYLTGIDCCICSYHPFSISLVSGDCIPMAFYSTESDFFGLCHVGLLGVLNRLPEAVAKYALTLNIPARSLRFLFGPYISVRTYDVSLSGLWTAIESQILSRTPWALEHVSLLGAKKLFDMSAAVRIQLLSQGIVDEHIRDLGYITDDGNYYSNYLHKRCGAKPGNFLTVFARTD